MEIVMPFDSECVNQDHTRTITVEFFIPCSKLPLLWHVHLTPPTIANTWNGIFTLRMNGGLGIQDTCTVYFLPEDPSSVRIRFELCMQYDCTPERLYLLLKLAAAFDVDAKCLRINGKHISLFDFLSINSSELQGIDSSSYTVLDVFAGIPKILGVYNYITKVSPSFVSTQLGSSSSTKKLSTSEYTTSDSVTVRLHPQLCDEDGARLEIIVPARKKSVERVLLRIFSILCICGVPSIKINEQVRRPIELIHCKPVLFSDTGDFL